MGIYDTSKNSHGLSFGLVDKNITELIQKPKQRNQTEDQKYTSVSHSATVDRYLGIQHIDSHGKHNASLQAAKRHSEHTKHVMLPVCYGQCAISHHVCACQLSNGGMLPCRARLLTICASAPHTVALVHVHLCRTCISAEPSNETERRI